VNHPYVALTLGLTAAAITVYGFMAVCCLLVRLRIREDVEFGPFAALYFALAALSALRLLDIVGSDRAVDHRMASCLGIAAYALLVHFAARATRAADAKRWILAAYATAAPFVVVALAGGLGAAGAVVAPTDAALALFLVGPGRMATTLHAASTLGAVAATFLLVRAALGGRRDLAGVAGSAGFVVLVSLHDLGVIAGALTTPRLGELGFFAFIFPVAAYFILRTERLVRALETNQGELERSYRSLRETQQELVRKEQLAVVGELAAVVAHEVRNPLAVIANSVAGLRKSTLSKEDQITLLGILDEETSRLNRIVSDLLRFARPVSVQRARVPLSALLERALKIARADARIDVETNVEVADVTVWADASLLRQVFDNLFENAVQAMSAEGTLSVGIRARKDDEGRDGVAVEIKDTGEGMDTIVKNRAKDPFFTTRPSGTGLGLAIVDRIVVAHGGHLLIDSRAGEGTTVTVFLPTGAPSDRPSASSRVAEIRKTDVARRA
jgi:signal transduction histidine kinase